MHFRLLKYFLINIQGTLVDTLVIWFLSRHVFSSYIGQYFISPVISFEVAMFHNYTISFFWIWKRYIPSNQVRDFVSRIIPYNLSVMLGFAVKLVFLIFFERLFRWDVVYCNLAALLISGLVNFFMAERMVFRKHFSVPVIDSSILGKAKEERPSDAVKEF